MYMSLLVYCAWQIDVPEPGIAGIPCGAHGALLAALSEYLVTVGPESVQFHACLPVAQRVVQDYEGACLCCLTYMQVSGAYVRQLCHKWCVSMC